MFFLLMILILLAIPHCLAQTSILQTPPLIVNKTNVEADLHCEQVSTSHDYMYWYHQGTNRQLKLIAYSFRGQDPTYEDIYKNEAIYKMGSTKGDKHANLKIKSLTTETEGVYYCASSATGGSSNQRQYFGQGTILSVLGEGEEEKDPKVKVFPPNKNEFQVHKLISLVCIATGFFPEHVRLTWYVNGVQKKDLYQNVPTKELDGTYSTSKRLSLTESEYFNPDSTFKCEAAFIGKEDKAVFDEIKGEQNCGVSKESFAMMINQGKISYIMVLFKSAVYALIVLVIIWRKKVLSGSC